MDCQPVSCVFPSLTVMMMGDKEMRNRMILVKHHSQNAYSLCFHVLFMMSERQRLVRDWASI